MSPSPIDMQLAEFVASNDHAVRFPIKCVAVHDGKKPPVGGPPIEEISVFFVRDDVLIGLLTLMIEKHVRENPR